MMIQGKQQGLDYDDGIRSEGRQDSWEWAAIWQFIAVHRSATLRPTDHPHFPAFLPSAEESVFPIGLES